MLRYISLLICCLLAGSSFGRVIKETTPGRSIEFYQNKEGVETKSAEFHPDGSLRVGGIKNLAGTGSPTGIIPVGGMISVMPTTHANFWQPPATGVIKDGFMRADGHVVTAQNVTDGCVFPISTALPDMVDMFARGGTTSGVAGGANEVAPTGTIPAPTFAGTPANRSDWFSTGSIAGVGVGHYHSTGAISAISLAHSHAAVTVTGEVNMAHTHASHDHYVGGPTGHSVGLYRDGSEPFTYPANVTFGFAYSFSSSYTGIMVADAITTTAGTIERSVIGSASGKSYSASRYLSGTFGNTGSNNSGDGTIPIDFGSNTNKASWAAGGQYTPVGTITEPAFTGDEATNIPEHTTVVWVIRVK